MSESYTLPTPPPPMPGPRLGNPSPSLGIDELYEEFERLENNVEALEARLERVSLPLPGKAASSGDAVMPNAIRRLLARAKSLNLRLSTMHDNLDI